MTITTTSRAQSIYKDTEAAEYIEWLMRIWNGLTDEQKASAFMDARPVRDMVMVGIRYTTPSDRSEG